MTTQKQFRILVVEDSEFFNHLLTNQLNWYVGEIALHKDCELKIDSCKSVEECLPTIKEDTDVAFVDYYLDDGKSALGIIKKLKEKNPDCKIVVISQAGDARNAVNSMKKDFPIDFIYKDDNALSKSCFFAEEIIREKLKTVN